jgi:hypothetical protein
MPASHRGGLEPAARAWRHGHTISRASWSLQLWAVLAPQGSRQQQMRARPAPRLQGLEAHGSEPNPLTTSEPHPSMSPCTMRREWMAGVMSTIGRGTISARLGG